MVQERNYDIPKAKVQVTVVFEQTLNQANYEGIDSMEAMIREEFGLLTADPEYLNEAVIYALENSDVTVTVKEI